MTDAEWNARRQRLEVAGREADRKKRLEIYGEEPEEEQAEGDAAEGGEGAIEKEKRQRRYCEICAGGHSTRYTCMECKADPINEGWSIGRDLVERAPDDLTPLERKITTYLARRQFGWAETTQQQIADDCGCTRQYVSKIHRRLRDNKFYRFKAFRDRLHSERVEKATAWRHIIETENKPTEDQKSFIDAAWREWRVNQPLDDGRSLSGMEVHPPRWFRLLELGYGMGEEPSLEETCRCLQHTNTMALNELVDPPLRVTYPLDFYFALSSETFGDGVLTGASVPQSDKRGANQWSTKSTTNVCELPSQSDEPTSRSSPPRSGGPRDIVTPSCAAPRPSRKRCSPRSVRPSGTKQSVSSRTRRIR